MQLRSVLATMLLGLALISMPAFGASMTEGRPVAPFTAELKSGDYVWLPQLAPAGPVVIVVSLSEQLLYVYRNGTRIGRSSISSGKPGHRTPTGFFVILEKNVKHISSIYKGASMPFMERLTWGGVALHAGNLPGYPAAHGCVRMPLDFAKLLYTVTKAGTAVIVTEQKPQPGLAAAAGLLFNASSSEAAPEGGVVWNPRKAPAGPLSIIVSSANHEVYLYRNGAEIGRAPVGKLGTFGGSYVYSALDVNAEGSRDWFSIASVGGSPPKVADLMKRVSVDPQFLARVRALLAPGASLILTDTPVTVSTRSPTGFNILTTAEKL